MQPRTPFRDFGAGAERVICMLCPGPSGSARAGGIGTFLSNFGRELPRVDPTRRISLIDTRGPGHIAFFPLYSFYAAMQVLSLAVAGSISLIHANLAGGGSTLRKLGFAALAVALRIPFVIHLHGPDYDAFYRDLHPLARSAVRWMFWRASRVVVLSPHWERFVVEEVGITRDRVAVICNGVTAPTVTRGAMRRVVGATHVVFLGRLEERKGVSDLLVALASPAVIGRDWHATLAGDGDPTRYQEQARRLGLDDRVAFPGWLDAAAVARLLETASLLVLPSRAEGLPMAILEALAHRIPVVTTAVGAIPDFLTDGESALLVEPGNPRQLAQALSNLMHSPEMQARLAAGGWRVFGENFDAAAMTRKLVSVYRSVENEGRP